MHEIIQEVEFPIGLWAGNRFDFDPLGEHIDGNQNSVESS
jgi:hypothetical protein